MSYNFAADRFQTDKLCSRLSSKEVDFYTRIGHFAFLIPLRLEAAYDVHLTLIGKRIVDFRHFLLVIIELFSLGVDG